MKYKEGLRPEGRCFILAMNERACTPCGENFEQHRVRDAAVEDDRRLDSGIDRVQAGVDLWNHAAGDRPVGLQHVDARAVEVRSEEPTSELQSLMRISYDVFCLKNKQHIRT